MHVTVVAALILVEKIYIEKKLKIKQHYKATT